MGGHEGLTNRVSFGAVCYGQGGIGSDSDDVAGESDLLSLARDRSEPRPVYAPDRGRVIAVPEVSGLHHHDEPVAASPWHSELIDIPWYEYSGATGCVFRAKVATDSGRNLPPIPVEGCH